MKLRSLLLLTSVAVYGAKQVAQASSQQALQQAPETLFLPVAPTLQADIIEFQLYL